MNLWEATRLVLICGALHELSFAAWAESVADHAVLVSATVQSNPAQLRLVWPNDPNATGYVVRRKLRDDSSWGAAISLAGNATIYVDTNVVVGSSYEYDVSKSAST